MNARDLTSRPRLPAVIVGVLVVVVLAGGLAAAAEQRTSQKRVAAPATTVPAVPGVGEATAGPPQGAPSTTAPAPSLPPEPPYVTRIKQQVAQLRGLEWKAPLKVDVVSKAELTRRYQAGVQRDTRPERLAADGDTFHVLHLIPRSVDYAKTVEGLFSGLILGFYDTKTRELVVGNSAGSDPGGSVSGQTKMTLAHELDHALADQWFDFGGQTDALDAADRQEELDGYTALIEGDAKLLEERFADKYLTDTEQLENLLGGLGGGEATKILQAPRFLLDYLYFPYTQGLEFTKDQAEGRGNAGVDAAFRRPPTSTEQVLHPDRYAAREGWSAPALPDVAAATGCQAVRRGTLGEFKMREVLDAELTEPAAADGADGWNGDTFQTVRCGGALGLVDRWEADDRGQAAGLVAALTRWAPGWSGGRSVAAGRFSGPNGSGRIVATGTRVDMVLADDAPTADRMAAALA